MTRKNTTPNSQTIGNVRITKLGKPPIAEYTDGDIEDRLLEHFKNGDQSNISFLTKNPGWAAKSFVSKQRENLLNWYDFEPGCSVLEIGAGCGPITEFLTDNCGSVTAIEISERRATINAYRNKEKTNLEIINGNLEDLKKHSNKRYDYVVCVGVLEYAAWFLSKTDDPFLDFTKLLRSFTKTNGTLMLAIENKLGLKYWAGAREDHVGRLMEGLEGYPHNDGPQTFGKKELTELLNSSGFNSTNYYYPFPDYKMPDIVYSDSYLPGAHNINLPSRGYPTSVHGQEREQIIREQLVVRSISKNGLYDEFANSFLVLASPSNDKVDESASVFSQSGIARKPMYQIITRILRKDHGFIVEKKSLNRKAENHIKSISDNYKKLSTAMKTKNINLCHINHTGVSNLQFEFIDGQTLEDSLIESLVNGDEGESLRILKSFEEIIDSFKSSYINPSKNEVFVNTFGDSYAEKTKCMNVGVLDINFDNIIERKGKNYLIDYEWVYDFPIPNHYIFSRSLLYFFTRYSQLVRGVTTKDVNSVELGENFVIPLFIYNSYKSAFDGIDKVIKSESVFQSNIGEGINDQAIYDKPVFHDNDLLDNLPDVYQHLKHLPKMVDDLNMIIKNQEKESAVLRNKVNMIENSPLWGTFKIIRSAKRRIVKK